MPADARTQDAAGAEAFVRYYFELLNRSLTNMETEHLRYFAEDACDVCDRIATETETDAAEGYTYSGGQLTILGKVDVRLGTSKEAETAFVARQAPRSTSSPVPPHSPGTPATAPT